MKSTGVAYALAALGLLSPVAGVHRFYLGRPVSGIFYLLTWGFFGIGTIIDLITLPRMVDDENRRLLYPGPPLHHRHARLGAASLLVCGASSSRCRPPLHRHWPIACSPMWDAPSGESSPGP